MSSNKEQRNAEIIYAKLVQNKPYQQIAEEFNITRQRAHDIVSKSIQQSKKELFGSEFKCPQVEAATTWCRLTNALIRKYKPMSETNPEEAIKQMNQIIGGLMFNNFLSQKDLDMAL